MLRNYQASAPATIFIAGEHAVLRKKPAIVSAIDKRLQVTLTPKDDQCITINSDVYGKFATTCNDLTVKKPYQFILTVLQYYQARLPSGCTINVKSKIATNTGLGSSAAITAATLSVVQQWLAISYHPTEFIKTGISITRKVQGKASGADFAASVYGGTVFYCNKAQKIEKLPVIPNLSLIYVGYKTSTAAVIGIVDELEKSEPLKYAKVFNSIEEIVFAAKKAICTANWSVLANLFSQHFELQQELGVVTDDITAMADYVLHSSNCLAVKISGSGLGDCLVTINKINNPELTFSKDQIAAGVKTITISSTTEGLKQNCSALYNGKSRNYA